MVMSCRRSADGDVMRSRRAGDIVTTGTCTGFQPVAPGDSVTADFGTLGRVEVSFTG